ncbi:3-hydroxyanthranilic acid dioxygenase [Chytridiales sp. JEL 0842]|nr:3-hydroxyanthranilic acid dioxygenase [Chytridiales sp. JEL 0842]
MTSPTPNAPLPSYLPPINFQKWVEENAHRLQPPVNNFCIYQGDMIVMAVGGPNKRSDYHVNPTPEWFFQHKGSMLLKIHDPASNTFHDITIPEGAMLLLPANTPHNPVRFADTVGIVIEVKRPEGSLDGLRWYCEGCKAVVYEERFYCTDLGTQLKPVIEKWAAHEELRVCKCCGFKNLAK